ncbi:iron chelate uptake ABC transporter family permease subunit [Pannonibacter indicus]|uniref:ABC-type enterochelin transport system, permease component n=1 Tax=Pannonibacter indicus TaxID=466044 RepID=A0A0K6I871_9HYPH|nr:iron chelate uptake ABC transporter family permease subunit [Pannonibacter indicus]CUA99325.1 ABC-type enterochelin transport system, permease component [Pannonibacter indicus]
MRLERLYRTGARRLTPAGVLLLLGLLTLAAATAFMTLGVKAGWAFILPFRGQKLASLVLVAYAVAVSTVLFQTLTNNRILTPSIMGFDALYVLLQTVLVFTLGSAFVTSLDPRLLFVGEVAIMAGFSLILFQLLFSGAIKGLHLMMLVGILLGALFRSLAGFLQRVIDPNEFVVLQDRFFASFNAVDGTLLGVSALLIAGASLAAWRLGHTFDVMALGRDSAIMLGVDHARVTRQVLMIITVLVSVSTALVGPVTFFGLLTANLAYLLMPSGRHRHVLPAAVLIAIICLVAGQTVLERLLDFNTALAIVIEFAGGLFFIFFLLKGARR